MISQRIPCAFAAPVAADDPVRDELAQMALDRIASGAGFVGELFGRQALLPFQPVDDLHRDGMQRVAFAPAAWVAILG